MPSIPLGTILLPLAIAGPALANAPTIEYIHGVAGAVDVSADGTVVLCVNMSGGASLWTSANGLQPIGTVALGPTDLSDDGTTVTGAITVNGKNVAAHWTQATGWRTFQGGIDQCDLSYSSAWSANHDGTIVTGMIWQSCRTIPVRWDADGMTMLDRTDDNSARPQCVSDDGSLVGGWQQLDFWTPCIWRADGTQEYPVGTDVGGEVCDVTSDGTWAVGYADGELFRWSDQGGAEMLGALGFSSNTRPFGVSEDGGTIVGSAISVSSSQAFIWSESIGLASLRPWLVAQGVSIPISVSLRWAEGVSADGRTIVGGAYDSSTFESYAYIVRLPGPPCAADLTGSGDIGFDDILAVLSAWGPCPGCAEDLNGDDEIGFDDLLVVLSSWGPCP